MVARRETLRLKASRTTISLQQTGFTSHACHHVWLWALAPLFSALPPHVFKDTSSKTHTGGVVSVALSLGSPPVAVSNCLSLRCPDFPPPCSCEFGGGQPVIWLLRILPQIRPTYLINSLAMLSIASAISWSFWVISSPAECVLSQISTVS